MKVFNTVYRVFIPLLMVCALAFALKPIPVFAQDGREFFEITRQKEQLDTLHRSSELFAHALLMEGLVSQAGESLYRFLLLNDSDTARRGRKIASEVKGHIEHMRRHAQNDYQVQTALNEFEEDFAKYTAEFDALFKARKNFLDQYDKMVSSLVYKLKAQVSSLAKSAAATGNTDVCHMLVIHAQSIGNIDGAVTAFFHSGWQSESQRTRAYIHKYSANLSKLKKVATPEIQTALSEIDDTMDSLKDAFDSLYELGASVAMHSHGIRHSLGIMKERSTSLCDVLQARQRAAFQDVGRKIF